VYLLQLEASVIPCSRVTTSSSCLKMAAVQCVKPIKTQAHDGGVVLGSPDERQLRLLTVCVPGVSPYFARMMETSPATRFCGVNVGRSLSVLTRAMRTFGVGAAVARCNRQLKHDRVFANRRGEAPTELSVCTYDPCCLATNLPSTSNDHNRPCVGHPSSMPFLMLKAPLMRLSTLHDP